MIYQLNDFTLVVACKTLDISINVQTNRISKLKWRVLCYPTPGACIRSDLSNKQYHRWQRFLFMLLKARQGIFNGIDVELNAAPRDPFHQSISVKCCMDTAVREGRSRCARLITLKLSVPLNRDAPLRPCSVSFIRNIDGK